MNPPDCPKCGSRMTRGAKTPTGKIRWQCRNGGGERRYCYSTTAGGTAAPRSRSGDARAKVRSSARPMRKRVIVTAAQNATPVHEGFWLALLKACEHLDADLRVIPLRYKNPTSRWTESQANEEVWSERVTPYLCTKRVRLNQNLVLLGDVKTQPTAMSPLTGFDAITEGESGILGHTKLQLRSVATPQNRYPKLLTTTGACTSPNYTDSKAGKLGEFHHCLGATLVELDGKHFHLRQLNADKKTGAFQDLDKVYAPEGVTEGTVEAIVLGDAHVGSVDPAVERATFGSGGMVGALRPKYLVWHDLLDGYAVNPHHQDNPFIRVAKEKQGLADIAQEVARACRYVQGHTPEGATSLVVASNHDEFLRRWLMTANWKNDPINALFYLATAKVMCNAVSDGERFSPLGYWMSLLTPGVRYLDIDESFQISGIETGVHGDLGPNGSRGSVRNLRRIGVKSVIGHSHSPAIEEGCYQVGTMTKLRLEYNLGPSSWLNTHCLIYPSGKRSLVNIIDGEWRL